MQIWTAPSTRNCFKHSLQEKNDSACFSLDAAKGELVSMQVLLRHSEYGKVYKNESDAISRTTKLTDVEITKTKGSEFDTSLIRVQAQQYVTFVDEIAYPDPISNGYNVEILPNTTQGMWVTFNVLQSQKAGKYQFSIKFKFSDEQESIADVSLRVYDVAIPSPDKCEYLIEHFQTPEDQQMLEHAGYKIKAFDEKWWQFMEQYAKSLRECRSNVYRIYPLELMKAAGSRRISKDKWEFDFTLFDKMVDLLLKTGTVRKFSTNDILTSWDGKEVFALDENGEIVTINISEPEAEIWLKEYFTALYEHITAHSKAENWIMHIQDEPYNAETWIWVREFVRKYMPKLACGNPFDTSVVPKLGDNVDLYIPVFHVFEDNLEFYKEILKKPNKEVWSYCCCLPCYPSRPEYLNRFIDSPAMHARLIGWATYSRGLAGFLHYGYSFWQKTEQFYYFGIEKFARHKGDCMLIYPSPEDNSYRISVRYINIRDGAQDYELLKIVEKYDKEKALNLSKSIAIGYKNFVDDEKKFIKARRKLLKLAEEAYNNK